MAHGRFVNLMCVFTLLTGTSHVAHGKEIEFRGWPIGDKAAGIAIAASKQKDAILILNQKVGYLVAIPYASIWKFQFEEEHRFTGESTKFLVTVSLDITSSQSPAEELENILKNLKDSGAFSIEEAEIINTGSRPVLRYRSYAKQVPKELEKLNDRQWHYWNTAPADGRWASVHLSLKELGIKRKAKDDEQVLDVLSRGGSPPTKNDQE